MKFALCNEMFENRPIAEVCSIAGRLGFNGIEIAPFTLARSASDVTTKQRKEVRCTIEDHGLETVGLHWLFVGPTGLHITTPDDAVWRKTKDYLRILLDLCGKRRLSANQDIKKRSDVTIYLPDVLMTR